MAEQYYAAISQSFSAAPYTIPTQGLPSCPPLPSNCDVKQETFGPNDCGREQETGTLSRPKKRVKTADEGKSHKFVSQKKWKFSDTQPWLASKTSSKAQNASKANTKYQHRSPSPKRSASPHKALPVGLAGTETILTQLRNRQAQSQNQQNRSDASTSLSTERADTRNVDQDYARGQQPPSQTTRKSTPAMARNASQSANPRTEHGMNQSSSPDTGTKDTTKLPRTSQTLSLEKDKERIAALIAEKRKENESSLFRERMLRKQLEHKNQKEGEKQTAKSADVPDNSDVAEPRVSHSPFSDRESSQSFTESSPTSTVVSITSPDVHDPPQTSTNFSYSGSTTRTKTIGRTRKPDPTKPGSHGSCGAQEKPHVEGFATSKNIDPEVGEPLSGQTRRDVSFSQRQPSLTRPQSTLQQSPSNDGHDLQFLQPHGMSGPFEVEDAEVTAQFIAFTNQFLFKGSAQSSQPQTMNNSTRQVRPTYYQRQVSTPTSIVQSQAVTQPGPSKVMNITGQVNGSFKGTQQSTSLPSSHTPASMSIRQRSQPNVLPSQPSAIPYAPASMQNESAASNITQSGRQAYHAMNQQMFMATRQQAEQLRMASQAAHSVPVTMQIITNTANPGVSVVAQQRLPQPPVLTSNVNMFNGEARSQSGSGNGMPTTPAKPRVNMFSNTKGSPFTMHEVIRQIEMT